MEGDVRKKQEGRIVGEYPVGERRGRRRRMEKTRGRIRKNFVRIPELRL